jgi:hypothetical protein
MFTELLFTSLLVLKSDTNFTQRPLKTMIEVRSRLLYWAHRPDDFLD